MPSAPEKINKTTANAKATADSVSTAVDEATELFNQYVAQAKALVAEEEWPEAIDKYKRALKLKTDNPFWIYLALGPLLVKTDAVDQAIECYRCAISIRSEHPKIYPLLGLALEKKQLTSQAISSYRRALKLDQNQPAWVHKKLADLLSQSAYKDNFQSAVHYACMIQKQDRLGALPLLRQTLTKIYGSASGAVEKGVQTLIDQLSNVDPSLAQCVRRLSLFGFLDTINAPVNPAGYYFVNETLKVVYCSIPKNACTLFKTMLVENSDLREQFHSSGENIHLFLNQRIKETSAAHLLACLNSDEYFKFVVIRNPFNRIVSGYLDKIAKHTVPEAFAQEVIEQVQTSLNEPVDIEKSITFSQFVDYLIETPDALLNDHWRPQCNFLGTVNFDLVGQFESLDTTTHALAKQFDMTIKTKVSNHITQYRTFDEADPGFCSMYPAQLRRLDGMPVPAQLYSPELKNKISFRYVNDIKTYEKAFGPIF